MAFLQPPTLTMSPPSISYPRPINSAGVVEGEKAQRHKLKHGLSRAISNETFPPLIVKNDSDNDTFDTQPEPTKGRHTALPYLEVPGFRNPSSKYSQQSEFKSQIITMLRSRRKSGRAKTNSSLTSSVTFGSSVGSQIAMHELKARLTHQELAAKFRRAIRLVRIVIRVRLLARDVIGVVPLIHETLEELNYYSMETEFFTAKLSFNRAEFFSSSTTTSPVWARLVMQQPPRDRTLADVRRLAALFRTIKTFKDTLSSVQQEDFARHCQYICVDKRHVLLKAGHRGVCCYFIFSGSLFVNIQEQEDGSEGGSGTGRSYYRTLCVLRTGDLVGEVALIHDVCRTATVTTREKAELLVLDKEVFGRVFTMDFKKQQTTILQHFSDCGIFNDWPEDALLNLAKYSRLVKHTYDMIVERNTQESQFIHLVIEGRIEVVRQVVFQFRPYSSSGATPNGDPFSDEAMYQRLKYPNQCSDLPVEPIPQPFLSLEILYPHSLCDLRSLISVSSSLPLSLVSKGATTIRIPKHHLRTLPHHKHWKDLLHVARSMPRYPSDEVLSQLYQEHLQWSKFKLSVLQDSLDKVHKTMIATKPQFLKGHCGWVPSKVKPHLAVRGEYNECLGCSDPLHMHSEQRECHEGACVLRSSAVRSKSPLLRSRPVSLGCIK